MKYILILALMVMGCKKEPKADNSPYQYEVEINSSKSLVTCHDTTFESEGYAYDHKYKFKSTKGVTVEIISNETKDFAYKVVIKREGQIVLSEQKVSPLLAIGTKFTFVYKP